MMMPLFAEVTGLSRQARQGNGPASGGGAPKRVAVTRMLNVWLPVR
jgi:hypothetical protein